MLEILETLLPNQSASDRPDIVSRVFHLKLKELLHVLFQRNALEHVSAFFTPLSFRNEVCHMHIWFCFLQLLTSHEHLKMLIYWCLQKFQIQQLLPEIHDTVKRDMLHGP